MTTDQTPLHISLSACGTYVQPRASSQPAASSSSEDGGCRVSKNTSVGCRGIEPQESGMNLQRRLHHFNQDVPGWLYGLIPKDIFQSLTAYSSTSTYRRLGQVAPRLLSLLSLSYIFTTIPISSLSIYQSTCTEPRTYWLYHHLHLHLRLLTLAERPIYKMASSNTMKALYYSEVRPLPPLI